MSGQNDMVFSSTERTVARIMQCIYADIHSVTRGADGVLNTDKDGYIKMTVRAQHCLKRQAEYCRHEALDLGGHSIHPLLQMELLRLEQFTTTLGWMMLAICAHSKELDYALNTSDDSVWSNMCLSIADNAGSIELFAKLRGHPWQRALPEGEQDLREKFDVRPDDPFHWYVAEDGSVKQPFFQGKLQKTIAQNIYPVTRDLSSTHSMRLQFRGNCLLCNSIERCNCSLQKQSRFFRPPLLELIACGTHRLGIRSLQEIPGGTLLGEYVGEIYSAALLDEELAKIDYTYALTMTAPDENPPPLAFINAAQYGNWTRFINHSCRPSTTFFAGTIAGRLGMFVKTLRKISIFEEITVGYAKEYSVKPRECYCGEEGCPDAKKGKEKMPTGSNANNTGDGVEDSQEYTEGEDSREYTEGEETGEDTGEVDSGPACQVIDTDITSGVKWLRMDD